MVVTDQTQDGRYAARLTIGRLRFSTPAPDVALPLLVTAALLAGLALVTVSSPIAARGDYGQWLMASRYYLGLEVPDYRTIPALPPVVPIAMAGIQLVIKDPIAALHAINVLLLVGMGIGLYLAGSLVMQSRWVGTLSAVLGLLVTDRFLELFAFGGLLQAASLMSMCVSVAAFARAARGPGIVHRWWLLGTLAMALAAMSHVGTGMIAVPTGFASAGLAALTLRRLGRRAILRALLPVGAAAVVVAWYWLIVLLPATGDYLTNPASLAYRGPDRLGNALLSYWPTAAVVLVGSAALLVGTVRDALGRLIDGWLFLTTWMAATWGALAFSVLTEAATDYPRFATLLLTPLAVAAAAGIVGASLAAGRRLAARNTRSAPGAVLAAAIVLTVLIASPLTVGRYGRQSVTYQPRNATALTAAVTWIDGHVADDLGVLTEVRDGKWLEGLTGREALFSQPVRYAFRPAEWQRSVDADAILRSVTTLTSGYMTAMYTSAAGSSRAVPTDLMLRANHGGEYVDVLRLSPSRTEISGAGGEATAAGLVPVRVAAQESDERVTLSTVWGMPDDDAFTFTQTVTLYIDGTTARVRQSAPGARLATELMPPTGMAMTSLAIDGDEAVACFTKLGATPPCVQITAAAGAGLSRTLDGGLRIESGATGEIDLLVTASTAGGASVSLAHLDPAEIVDARKIGAALLYAPDPSYRGRVARLESIGFREAQTFGPYVVLVRDGASAP